MEERDLATKPQCRVLILLIAGPDGKVWSFEVTEM